MSSGVARKTCRGQAWQAASSGAIQVDGKMVDLPVVRKAERLLAQAARMP